MNVKAGVLFFIIIANSVFAQHKGDYVVSLQNDTIDVTVTKNSYAGIVCMVNDKKVKFRAKNILAFRSNGYSYESGKYRDPGMLGITHWIYYKKEVSGELNLFSIIVPGKRKAGSKLYDYRHSRNTIYFIRKKETPRSRPLKLGMIWRKNFKKLCGDCTELMEKIKENGYWASKNDLAFYVRFYNEKCRGLKK